MKKSIVVDRNMEDNIIENESDLDWYGVDNSLLTLEGFEFYETDKVFRRLPLDSIKTFETVNKNINLLAENTSGGVIRFITNSKSISIKVKLKDVHDMTNMTACGQCGFDVYAKNEKFDEYIFFGITKFKITEKEYTCIITDKLLNGKNEIIINFPLYAGVSEVIIGLDKNATLKKAENRDKKFVFYGTSITQGGCATRPGTNYTSIIGRKFNAEIINLGFSGNGLAEYEMAEIITRIKNPDCIIIDIEANAGTNGKLVERLENFIKIVRTVQTSSTIFIVSRIPYALDYFNQDIKLLRDKLRVFQGEIVEKFNKNGDDKIKFIDGYSLIKDNIFECTVDFIHPTDYGLIQMAENLSNYLKKEGL